VRLVHDERDSRRAGAEYRVAEIHRFQRVRSMRTVPSSAAPSSKATVALVLPGPLTVAVNVTFWPALAGFDDEVTVVVDDDVDVFTVSVSAPELAARLESPL
jgi:hypothetical protein